MVQADIRVYVSKSAISLWKQILFGPLMIPLWGDIGEELVIRELLDSKLVKVVGKRSLVKMLELADPEMALGFDNKKVLLILEANKQPIEVCKLKSLAIEAEVAKPLPAIKKLIDLNLIRFDQHRKYLQTRYSH